MVSEAVGVSVPVETVESERTSEAALATYGSPVATASARPGSIATGARTCRMSSGAEPLRDRAHVAEDDPLPADQHLAFLVEGVERGDVGVDDLGHAAQEELHHVLGVEGGGEALGGACAAESWLASSRASSSLPRATASARWSSAARCASCAASSRASRSAASRLTISSRCRASDRWRKKRKAASASPRISPAIQIATRVAWKPRWSTGSKA